MVPSHSISLAFLTMAGCLISQVSGHFQACGRRRVEATPSIEGRESAWLLRDKNVNEI